MGNHEGVIIRSTREMPSVAYVAAEKLYKYLQTHRSIGIEKREMNSYLDNFSNLLYGEGISVSSLRRMLISLETNESVRKDLPEIEQLILTIKEEYDPESIPSSPSR